MDTYESVACGRKGLTDKTAVVVEGDGFRF